MALVRVAPFEQTGGIDVYSLAGVRSDAGTVSYSVYPSALDAVALSVSFLHPDTTVLWKSVPEVQVSILSHLEVPRFVLRRPLQLRIERGEAGYSVYDEIFNILGAGPTPEAATEDYQYALVSYYEHLLVNESRLSNYLKNQLQKLRDLIDEE